MTTDTTPQVNFPYSLAWDSVFSLAKEKGTITWTDVRAIELTCLRQVLVNSKFILDHYNISRGSLKYHRDKGYLVSRGKENGTYTYQVNEVESWAVQFKVSRKPSPLTGRKEIAEI